MTFLEMQTAVQYGIEDLAGKFFTLADVKTALNEAQDEMAEYTEYYETSFTLTRQANTTYYNLNAPGAVGVPAGLATNPILAVKRIFNVQTNRWLDPVSVRGLDEDYYAQWEAITGETGFFFMRGLWQLGLMPRQITTTGTLTCYGTAMPTALAANGDTPSVPETFHQGWVEYALYELMSQDAEIQKAMDHFAHFDPRTKELDGGYLFYAEGLKRWVNDRVSKTKVGIMGGNLWPRR